MEDDWKRAWLMALALEWMRNNNDGDGFSLLYVAAVVGQFRAPPSNAANGIIALLLFRLIVSAKYPAKYSERLGFLQNTRRRAWIWPAARKPAPFLARPGSSPALPGYVACANTVTSGP